MSTAIRSLPGSIRQAVENDERRTALAALSVLETESDPDLDRLTRLAAGSLGASMAFIGIVGPDGQQVRAAHGLDVSKWTHAAGLTLSAHTIANSDANLTACNIQVDERFAYDPIVKEPLGIRSFVAVPVVVRGQRVGAVCVLSRAAELWVNPAQYHQLADIAELIGSCFELKHEARASARTAAALTREEWRHALTLEAGRVGSWVWDLRADEMTVNDITRTMLGLEGVRHVTAEAYMERIDPDDRPAVESALQAAFEEGLDYQAEFRVLGTERWLVGRGRVYQRDGHGKPLVMMGIHMDMTEIREAAEHQRMLLLELNHRVKNTLAMIQSLARQTLRQTPDPQQFIDAFSGRLRTLSDSHALLSDRDWSGIGLAELIRMQMGDCEETAIGQLTLHGPDVSLPPDHALGLGLIIHELVSNALRHGALSQPEGTVDVTWERRPGPGKWVDLVWKESGGPVISGPVEYGLGARLIERSLSKVLESSVRLSFPPEGVEARISFPLPD